MVTPPNLRPLPRRRATARRSRRGCPTRKRIEFETLPERIAALEAEEARLQGVIAGPDFYRETATFINDTLARLEDVAAPNP